MASRLSDVRDCAHGKTNHRHDYDFFSCIFSFCGSPPFFDASRKAQSRPGMIGRPFPELAALSRELVIGKVLIQEERLVGDTMWVDRRADPYASNE